MPLKVIAPQRIYQRIAEQIGDMILDGEFEPAQRLPPERELARTFGVSRNVVREAMVALEIAGLVDVRVGAGTFVSAPGQPADIAELRLARCVLETEIAALAAQNRTEPEIAAIREAAEQAAQEAESGRSGLPCSRRFHLALAEATRNRFLVSVVRQLWGTPGHALRLNGPACRRIAQAVADGDVEGARAAMRAHFGVTDAPTRPGVAALVALHERRKA